MTGCVKKCGDDALIAQSPDYGGDRIETGLVFWPSEHVELATIQLIFAFDFADCFPHMRWDDTSHTH